MQKIFSLVLCLVCALWLAVDAAALTPVDIISSSAVLMDASTGQVLFEKNMHAKMYPASTTKIMTALLVVENCNPNELVTVSKKAVDIEEPDSANIALSEGEQLTVDSALYALMLPSANDAANALAEYMSGTQAEFAWQMTKKAHDIGAVDTKFANAHGLHDPRHYTTAYDLALITRYASKNPTFLQYFGAAHKTIPGTNLQPIARPFTNYQYMLVPETAAYDPDVIGGKVGYTEEAKHTMSTIAARYGRTLICIVMNSSGRNDKFRDTEKLLDFGFNEFNKVTIPKDKFAGFSVPVHKNGEAVGTVSFDSQEDFVTLLHNSISPDSIQIDFERPEFYEKDAQIPSTVTFEIPSAGGGIPTVLGTQLLTTQLAIDGKLIIASTPDFAEREASNSALRRFFQDGKFYIVLLLVCVLVFLVSMVVLRQHALRKRRRKRQAKLRQRAIR